LRRLNRKVERIEQRERSRGSVFNFLNLFNVSTFLVLTGLQSPRSRK